MDATAISTIFQVLCLQNLCWGFQQASASASKSPTASSTSSTSKCGWAGQFAADSSFHQILSVSRKLKTSFHVSQKANGKWYEMIKTDADNSAGVGGSICNTQRSTNNPLGFWVGTEGQGKSWTKLPPSWEQAHWGLELIAKPVKIVKLVHLYCNWNPLILQILRQIRRNMKKPWKTMTYQCHCLLRPGSACGTFLLTKSSNQGFFIILLALRTSLLALILV